MNTFAELAVVYIVTTGRNGSIFFQSLLDSHPQILMISQIFEYPKFWRANHTKDKELLIDRFIEFFPNLFCINSVSSLKFDELGEDKNEKIMISKRKFKSKALDILAPIDDVTEKTFFYAIHYAYDYVRTGKDSVSKKVIVHHIHDVHELLRVKDFPCDAKVISLCRDPRATIRSTYLSKSKITGFCNLGYFYRQMVMSLNDISELVKRVDKLDYIVLKLEDIHKFQKLILEQVCNFIDIDFDPVLLESTIYGHKWWGDRTTEKNVNGFIENFEDDSWRDFYSQADLRIIAYFFRKRFDNFEYDPKVKPVGKYMLYLLLLLPMKPERDYVIRGNCAGIPGGSFISRLWKVFYTGFRFRMIMIKQDKLINVNYRYLYILKPSVS